MTTKLVLSCILWVSSQPTEVLQQPIDYGMAEINLSIGEFKFHADVFEEKMNYVEITHVNTGAVASAYTLEWPQRTLATRLQIAGQQSSLDCEIKKTNLPEPLQ